MIDLSTLPVPDGCPFKNMCSIRQYKFGRAVELEMNERFIICATMTAWLAREIDYWNDQDAPDEYLEELGLMHNKWSTVEAEAYAAIKEQSNASN